MVNFYDETQVRAVLEMPALIAAMEQALIDLSAGRVVQPVRYMLDVQPAGGFYGNMQAIAPTGMGTKMVCFFPGNAERGIHTHHAIVALFDPDTGEPLAVMGGGAITELRTAAVSAAATKALAAPDAKVLAVLGTGVQARSHIEALRHVRDFDEIRIWGRTPANAEKLAEESGGVAMAAADAVRGADVVVTATSSQTPVLEGAWLKPGTHVNAVGAPRPDWRELDDAVMANCVIADSYEAASSESGDVILSGAKPRAELGEVLAGKIRIDPAETTVFKSLGLAVEDIATARLVYDAIEG